MSGATTSIEDAAGRSGWFPPEGEGSWSRLVYQLYGFTEEELDFIINYDIKYRMGDELGSQE